MGLNKKPSNVSRSTKFTNIFQFRKFDFAKNLLPSDIWIKFSWHPSLRISLKLSFSLKLSSPHTLQFRTLRRKFPYLELFWFAVSCIWTEYGEIWSRITPNTDIFHAMGRTWISLNPLDVNISTNFNGFNHFPALAYKCRLILGEPL